MGDGGDKDARQDMMPSQVPSYNDDDLIGTDCHDGRRQLRPGASPVPELRRLRDRAGGASRPGTGAQLHRYSQGAPGIYAFSRIDRDEQVEYIVAFNNANDPQTATFATDSPSTTFTEIYPGGGADISSDAGGNVTSSCPL